MTQWQRKDSIEEKLKEKKNQQHLGLIIQTGPVRHCVCWDDQVLQEMVPVLHLRTGKR